MSGGEGESEWGRGRESERGRGRESERGRGRDSGQERGKESEREKERMREREIITGLTHGKMFARAYQSKGVARVAPVLDVIIPPVCQNLQRKQTEHGKHPRSKGAARYSPRVSV